MTVRNEGFRLFDIGEYGGCPLKVGLALLRHAELPGRSVQQPDVQTVFEARNLLADRRRGQFQDLRRRGEAALANDIDENAHLIAAFHRISIVSFKEKNFPKE